MSGCATSNTHSEAPSRADRAAQLLSDAIQIPTVNPPGDERPLAEFFAASLAQAGIESRVVNTPRGDSKVGRASVWGIVRGSGRARPIVLLSHLDVVPADAAQWEHDPFAGKRVRDHVIGRGALDAKGVSVVHLLTMRALARRKTPLQRDVIFLGTPDEETGGLDGAGYIAQHHRDLLRNAEYLLTEGGGILVRGDGTPQLWRIGVVEKSPCWLRVVSHGSPGHSSVPPRDAAVPRLISALERVSHLEFPVRVVPEVARMYAALADLAPEQDAEGFADLAAGLESDPKFKNRFMTLRHQAALVSNTLTATVLEGAPRTNVLPAEAIAHLDIRLLPGESCETTADRVRGAVADSGITVEPLLSFDTLSSPVNTALYRAIVAVAERADPPARTVPSVTIGFTDSHYFRDLGITSYGFTPRPLRRDDGRGVHGHNESANIPTLLQATDTLLAILTELDR
jgi:acetylornithine deacetylase/succinyl-diaminopimelate desuccinylase-like protein